MIAHAGSGLQVLSDVRPCYEEAARRALAHEGDDAFGTAVERVLALDDQRWSQLVGLIADMLPARDRWLPLLVGTLHAASGLDEVQLANLRAHFDQDLGLLITRTLLRAREILGGERLDAACPLMQGAAQRLGVKAPHLATWSQDASALRAEAGDIARWRGFAASFLRADGGLRKQVNRHQGFPPGCADKPAMENLLAELDRAGNARDILRELRSLPDPVYSDEQWARVRDVAQVLVLAAAELDGVFREQGGVDFSAVSIAALRALGGDAPTDLALRLDYRLQHILVDEFQDTSAAQLELVRLLIAGWQTGDGRSAFCVGDPMQSIYGFREAEVRAFLELAEDGIGEVRFDVQRLQTNFRSTRPVVDWINACFSRLMPRRDDRQRGAIAFRPSQPSPQHAGGAQDAVQALGFADRQQESDAIAQIIESELRAHPHWQVAVLVRAKSHAGEIAASLRARGIAFRAVDIEPLQDRAVVRDIIMLARALLHFGDRIAWLAVLRAPWVGLELADLLMIARAHPVIWDALQDEALLQRLSSAGRVRCLRLRESLLAAQLVRNETPLARWIERTWLCLGGASCVADAQELELAHTTFSRLRILEERGLPDVAQLSESFAQMFADSGSTGAVQIMTIHRAKGLEFDFVVLPALNRASPPNRGQLLLSHQFARTGRGGMVMAARPPVGADRDGLFAAVTAMLDRLRFSVVEARILSSQTGMALDTFLLLESESQEPASLQRAEELRLRMQRALVQPSLMQPTKRGMSRHQRHFQMAPRIEFTEARERTQLALVCTDRPGLLAAVAQALAEAQVRVHDARIATFGERVEDFFQITDRQDMPLSSERRNILREALLRRIGGDSRNPNHANANA